MLTVEQHWMVFIIVNMILWWAFGYLMYKFTNEGFFIVPLVAIMFFNLWMVLGGINVQEELDRKPVVCRFVDDPKAEYKLVVFEDGTTKTLTEAKYVNNDIEVFNVTYENRFGYDSEGFVYEVAPKKGK